MNKFKIGDVIICNKDCYDNQGTLLHKIGEINRIYERFWFGEPFITIHTYLKMAKQSEHHSVTYEYISEHFITLSEQREKSINKILN